MSASRRGARPHWPSLDGPLKQGEARAQNSDPLRYVSGYPVRVRAQVRAHLEANTLEQHLNTLHPIAHEVRGDRALYDYVMGIKAQYLKSAPPLNKVCFDDKLHIVHHALGTHTYISRVQGQRLKAKRELRISGLFKEAPADLLRMIVVHELAHLRERAHNKAFYQLCLHMEPEYHQLELSARLFLILRETSMS